MGTGFWVIQAILLTAAIATAVYAEFERRRDEEAAAALQFRQVPVERSTAFTIHEQARLLLLRTRVHEARLGRGYLHDDLVPDSLEPLKVPPTRGDDARRPTAPLALTRPTRPMRPLRGTSDSSGSSGSGSRSAPSAHSSDGRWILVAGLALLAVGAVGMWQTNAAMDALERAQGPFTALPQMSLAARLLPGPIANPAKYLVAVNSGSANGTSIEAAQMLAQKEAMDRWAAALFAGLALLAVRSARSGPAARPRQPQQSSIAGDLVGLIALVALVYALLSFVELA